ncbi:hypothetical protein DSAG12_02087 [Promethearchaeum syntrophicum]|uniref:Uncharacterized protein n=1 Tax=Promethearchaeum syntrophicum TaxID=2594042 RepID=A0A5B9DBN0_9ARCH|nr:hypothetical protein [Candidatus Prometheoarchaeum syntrophicum]QEE16257.1 hypothetical protein DSAG12_02087 [Candidatus Prometheoarchaeum syntrophicum]
MDELGELDTNKPISKILTNKWLLSVFLVLLIELLIVYNQNWNSILLFLYPLFTIVGLFFFLIYNDLQHYQMKISNYSLKFHLFSNDSLPSLILFGSSFIQILIIGLFGLDSKNNPHLMQNYGIWYTILLILIFLMTWFLLSSLILINSRMNLVIKDSANERYKKFERFFGIDKKSLIKIQFFLIFSMLFLISLYLVDSLLITYSQWSIWKIKLLLPGDAINSAEFIYITGFSFFVLFFLPSCFLFILGFIIYKFRRIPDSYIDKINQEFPEINADDLEKIKKAMNFIKS